MKIYTKQGDKGHTRLYVDTPVKVRKDADELHCYGALDELNSRVGMLIAMLSDTSTELASTQLIQIQQDLFQIGYAISASTSLSSQSVIELEQSIDNMQADLPAQTHFILPGGSKSAAQAHLCRTQARLAERTFTSLLDRYSPPEQVNQYLNRLSDYFFVLARWLNLQSNNAETPVK